jgi:SAM-dependent methyltransferase
MKSKITSIENDEKYREKFGHGDDHKSLGWSTEKSQVTRFEILKQIPGFEKNHSVLDVGCGHGDFCRFLENYKGIDIRESVIKIAEKKYPGFNFEAKSISEENNMYDWVFGSGIFGFNMKDWSENVLENLSEMFKKSTKGVAVNFLSSLSTGITDPEMKYSSVGEVSDLISQITRNFVVRHDYRPNDFTVYIFKKEFI